MPKYEVEESLSIDAELDKVRSIVRDFKQWPPWSPWLSAEPDCPIEYAEDGKSYSWNGKIIGSGKMELTGETPTTLNYKLTFLTPFRSQADVSFVFAADGSKTNASWTMRSSLPFFMFFMVKMMKAWISSDYRRGLAKLKDYAETGQVPSQNEFVGEGGGLSSTYVGIRSQCGIEDLGRDMPPKYDRLKKWIDESGVQPTSPPLAIYHKFDPVKNVAEYTAAIPVSAVPADLPGDLHSDSLDEPKTYRVRHVGAYRHLGSAWSAGMMRERAKVFKSAKGHAPFEIYLSDPATTPEAELVTEIHFPVR